MVLDLLDGVDEVERLHGLSGSSLGLRARPRRPARQATRTDRYEDYAVLPRRQRNIKNWPLHDPAGVHQGSRHPDGLRLWLRALAGVRPRPDVVGRHLAKLIAAQAARRALVDAAARRPERRVRAAGGHAPAALRRQPHRPRAARRAGPSRQRAPAAGRAVGRHEQARPDLDDGSPRRPVLDISLGPRLLIAVRVRLLTAGNGQPRTTL